MISRSVAAIIDEVREGRDEALLRIATRLGDAPQLVRVGADLPVRPQLAQETKETINFAAANIRKFAESIMQSLPTSGIVVDYPGYRAGMRFSPVETAACYVPGGRYSLPSTALMTSITAIVAGVKNVYIVSPMLTDEVIYAGTVAGVTGFIRLGGAQAIAALAFGTETIPRADMIVGPGNAYVTEAKRQLQGVVGIDMLAGPSEVAIIADDSANARWLALDMLSQAEHDPDARCYLLTDSAQLADAVRKEISIALNDNQIAYPDFIDVKGLFDCIFVETNLMGCAQRSNQIAPEHLQLSIRNPNALRPALTNYGALFIGNQTTVPFGDYTAGPNHTLPTGGSARFSSGLTPLTFLRTQTWLELADNPPTELIRHTANFAQIEGLNGHAAAALARSIAGAAVQRPYGS